MAKLIHDEAPMIPLHYQFELTGVNNRVKNYDVAPGAKLTWKDVAVTSDKEKQRNKKIAPGIYIHARSYFYLPSFSYY